MKNKNKKNKFNSRMKKGFAIRKMIATYHVGKNYKKMNEKWHKKRINNLRLLKFEGFNLR